MIDSRFESNEQNSDYNYREIVAENIEEIKEIYNFSMKKSIIDYILLDQTEMDRLNINIKHRVAPLYGQRFPKFKSYDTDSLFRVNQPKI